MKKPFYVLAMTVAFAGCAVEQEYSRPLIFGMGWRLSWDGMDTGYRTRTRTIWSA